jgi:hypothetical protein
MNLNGIFLIILGLLIIIFYKTIARQTYEFRKTIFPNPFFITLGVLALMGV